jgi:hypothetical protein
MDYCQAKHHLALTQKCEIGWVFWDECYIEPLPTLAQSLRKLINKQQLTFYWKDPPFGRKENALIYIHIYGGSSRKCTVTYSKTLRAMQACNDFWTKTRGEQVVSRGPWGVHPSFLYCYWICEALTSKLVEITDYSEQGFHGFTQYFYQISLYQLANKLWRLFFFFFFFFLNSTTPGSCIWGVEV